MPHIADIKRSLRTASQKLLQANSAGANMKKRKVMLRGGQQSFQRALIMSRLMPKSPVTDKLKKDSEVGFANCKRQLNALMQKERKERAAMKRMHIAEEAPPPAEDAAADTDRADPDAPAQDAGADTGA